MYWHLQSNQHYYASSNMYHPTYPQQQPPPPEMHVHNSYGRQPPSAPSHDLNGDHVPAIRPAEGFFRAEKEEAAAGIQLANSDAEKGRPAVSQASPTSPAPQAADHPVIPKDPAPPANPGGPQSDQSLRATQGPHRSPSSSTEEFDDNILEYVDDPEEVPVAGSVDQNGVEGDQPVADAVVNSEENPMDPEGQRFMSCSVC